MQIKKAEFIISNTDYKKCPPPTLPEYAFIGRSNVGKSSLINMLTERKALAKTSSTPGKTTLINHFNINDDWYLVDLPGYGYAKTSKTNREKYKKIIETYILRRENLLCVFVLLDARHEPQKLDLEFMEFLGENGIPFAMIFTKADKISKSILNKNQALYKSTMLETWEFLPKSFITSSETGLGRADILDYIEDINQNAEF